MVAERDSVIPKANFMQAFPIDRYPVESPISPVRIALFRMALFLMALIGLTGTLLGAPKVARAGAPKIRLEESPEFYGTFYKGERFVRKIVVHNDGDAPLNLIRITPKCSCSRIVTYPKVIMPGEKGELEMEVDSDRIAVGNQEKIVSLITDDPVSPRTVYAFRVTNRESFAPARTRVGTAAKPAASQPKSAPATSRPKDSKDPRSSAEFTLRDGASLRGLFDQSKRAVIEIRSNTTDFKIKGVTSVDGRFRVDGFESAGSGRRYWVTVSADAVLKPAKAVGKLQVVADFQGRTVYWQTPLAIEHFNYVWLDPGNSIRLLNRDTDPLLQPNAPPIIKTLRAKAAEGLEFKILATRFEGIPEGIFEAEIVPKVPGRDYEIRIILREYPKKTFVRGKLLLETSEAKVGTLEISIQAIFGKRRG